MPFVEIDRALVSKGDDEVRVRAVPLLDHDFLSRGQQRGPNTMSLSVGLHIEVLNLCAPADDREAPDARTVDSRCGAVFGNQRRWSSLMQRRVVLKQGDTHAPLETL